MTDRLIHRIMVVDDDRDYRSMVQMFLELEGFVCEPAANADEALEKQRRGSFDLVISDVRMAGKDGIQLMGELLREFPGLQVIIMTGHAAEYSYKDILEAGAADFIAKPFEMLRLKAKIERLERENRILAALRETNQALLWESRVNGTFADLSKALISPLSFEDMSRVVLDCAKDLTESELGSVLYVGDRNSDSAPAKKARDSLAERRPCIQCLISDGRQSLCLRIPDTDQPVFYNSGDELPDSLALPLTDTVVHRLLSFPAQMDGKLIGQILVANATRDYSKTDLQVIGRLADIYALAINRKHMEERLLTTQEELCRARDKLQTLLEERTERLSKAADLLKRSIQCIRNVTQAEPGTL
jgi:DNA-binding response OmpR family regulator